ncbi:two-component system, cell cycle response regulator [Psychrobacillus sp. OK028]|uniref:GGDEF domain-containing protein n=1 Tax=Psychrobacillus sp. OK028 TaxID=1884359 RepID=UPI00088E8FF9|nr:GGDEF domain-containing protein [Psychrobacillus sp. OK028]SDN26243.1 two-component system, cell cycle response regulator [Psychrobacillus sp. OK028]
MNKKRFKYSFVLIFLFTVVLVFIDTILTEEASEHYPFIWSLSLIPIILIANMYPKWKVIIGSGIFYSFLKYTTEFSQQINPDNSEINALILGSLINWSIILTIGYFINKSYKLLLKVEELTITDPLTGIYNRRYLELFMEKSIPIYKRTNSSLVFMMLDIDHFKKVNDNYGHQCGDEALRHTSSIISNNVRNSDVFVRFGGEEFAVILPNTDVAEGLIIAERIRADVEKSEFIYKNERINFTISIGVSFYNGDSEEELITKSDNALYKAKEEGRNQIAIIK